LDLQKTNRAQNIWAYIRKLTSGDQGSELVEFAFVLPFFLLIIVGLIDFGGAWGMKDKIAGAARDGARVAVASFNDSTNPQCAGTSCAVQASTDAVIGALTDANVNTCGMTGAGMAPSGAAFTWTESVPCANGGNFTITVARAVPEVDASSGTNVQVLTTQVTV
jgi:Flp pilus assembly protein TadG